MFKKLQPKYSRFLLHLFFWVLVYLFFIVFYGRSSRDYGTTIIFVSMLLPLSIITTYFLNYFIIPRYLFTKKYGKFVLFVFYTFVVSIWLEMFISLVVFILITNYQADQMNPSSFDGLLLMVGLYFIIIIAVAIKLVRRSFQIQKKNTELDNRRFQMELKLKEAELKLLKAQVHPHFLFNTLNNLYGLTLEKSDDAPKLVLQLSEILDYILYRCDEKLVSLGEELANLKNYIEIEKIRYSGKLKLTANFPEETGHLKIAPLILLPFVENAFKHGVSHSPGITFVSINIKIVETNLFFKVENSKNPAIKNEVGHSNGVGLKNVRKRLDLIYPGKYMLKIDKTEKTFSVNLSLQLEE
ncbi:sensor histidine kinase [Mariniphaga sp.]|uniref:sensor histidine kinase n=1 Tax=Mariniphaga sp. TaxID=1954475 RepID=UPI00356347B0